MFDINIRHDARFDNIFFSKYSAITGMNPKASFGNVLQQAAGY